ncbi:hypothetical protein DXG01_007691 [Tephrocybe rancida]|nr:hypothetical protein DXG01_007691 [Tephrocybe rancida]
MTHNSNATSRTGRSVHWPSSEESVYPPRSVRMVPETPYRLTLPLARSQQSQPLTQRERYVYTYKLLAGSTPIEFQISSVHDRSNPLHRYQTDRRVRVEPVSGTPTPGKYTFRLSVKANGIERVMCDPTILRLSMDPRGLDFAVFVFPGKSSAPAGSMFSLRIWLRVNGVDHRVFSDDELWIGKDLDFYSISQASIMILRNVDSKSQLYHGWHRLNDNLYKYTIDYDANGVGGNFIEDLRLRIDGDPRTMTFLIYTVPINSVPAGSSHRVRIWTKSLVSHAAGDHPAHPFQDSYIYQRIYKNDLFKIGGQLDFNNMSNKATVGFAVGPVKTITTPVTHAPPQPTTVARPGFPEEKSHKGYQ